MAISVRQAEARGGRSGGDTSGPVPNGPPGSETGRHRRDRPWRRRLRRFVLVVLVTLVFLALIPAVWIVVGTSGSRHAYLDVPDRSYAIVLGAGLRPGSRPSPYLERRLETAARLYEQGKVERVLVSGHSTDYHDEAGVMRRWLLDRGIPESDIEIDSAGIDTYDSCWRARWAYGIEDAIVVTQEYHLPRAVYTCREIGMDAVGVGASGDTSNPFVRLGYTAREIPADYQALWELHVARPVPEDRERSLQD